MSRCTFLVVLAAATASTVTLASADSRYSLAPSHADDADVIVGGEAVPPGKWPDTVAVLGDGTCTGTLIAPDVVLTAGHCADMNPVAVVANTVDYSKSGGTRVAVAQTIAYPDWETTYDVAVVVLAKPITTVTPRAVGTACTYQMLQPATPVRLVGFGSTSMDGSDSNTVLKEAMTEVTDPMCMGNGCNKVVSPGGEFIAGGTGSADSCFGDSGGPVYLATDRGPIVIGAVSRGVDNSATPCGGGGIYVRTDKIIAWIEETTGKQIAKDACEGTEYQGSAPTTETDASVDEVGCSATRSGSTGLGTLALVTIVMTIGVRRRDRRATNAA